jgi:putative tryptophan/tyrosine transport system substrate-binding protein
MTATPMNRRDVLTGLAIVAAGASLQRSARAQTRPDMLRVGAASPSPRATSFTVAFEQRMRELGYVEGSNFEFHYIDLQGRSDRYEAAMQDLVRRNVDVIVAFGPEAPLKSALALTKTIPIVMVAIDYDPFALGYVTSLARPTGNVTGLFLEQIELAAKRIELIKDAFPDLPSATVFWDELSADQWRATQQSAAKLGLPLAGIELHDYPYDYERALAQAAPEYRRFLIVTTSPYFARDRELLPQFVLRQRIAAMFVFREYVERGGLMSYGPNRTAMSRRTADYVHRLARGAKPSDLPIERPNTFEMVINLKTAKLLGLQFSQAMLLRADEVIE